MKSTRLWIKPLALGIALAALPGLTLGDNHDEDDDEETSFEEAEIFFELNHTDGDLGIHALIDGEPWHRLVIEGPDNRKLLNIRVQSHLRKQGLTEIFFESAEPTFDELDPVDFFDRFPEGEYEIEGRTLERDKLESETELTHAIPAPPEVMVNGKPASEECDEDDPDEDNPTPVSPPVTLSWEPVTMSHPDADGAGAAVQPPVEIEVNNYEVVVEAGDSVFSLTLPSDVTEITLPDALLELEDRFKYEVLVREDSYNQTAVESCFKLE